MNTMLLIAGFPKCSPAETQNKIVGNNLEILLPIVVAVVTALIVSIITGSDYDKRSKISRVVLAILTGVMIWIAGFAAIQANYGFNFCG